MTPRGPSRDLRKSLAERAEGLIDQAHRLVNEARAERGLPPWDFTKPRERGKPLTMEERLETAANVPGLAGELLRWRLRQRLGQQQAARIIGLNLYRLMVIERCSHRATREEEIMIHFWVDEEVQR